jgi:tryptophan synthase alpha chain
VLEEYIKNRLQQKPVLLMTHIVLGYPDFDRGRRIVESMVKAGVDLMELQIPFSEPIADGPVILRANQQALQNGATVQRCLEFARQAAAEFEIPFLFMSYYNILFKYGVERFAENMAGSSIRGSIVPDLPPEEGEGYLRSMRTHGLDPIFIFTPKTSEQRMKRIASDARGFIYCVARRGVTGSQTDFSAELGDYLARCRRAIPLPLALGFGVKSREDVEFLRGKVDIAVIGTETMRLVDSQGVDAVEPFIRGLR